MSRSKVFTFVDPSQYASSVRSADLEIFPTSRGQFSAKLTQVTLDRLWMQSFEETLPRLHRGSVKTDRKVFTFLTEDQPEVYNRGKLFSLGEICANDTDLKHVVTQGHYRLGGLSLEREDLATACRSMMDFEYPLEESSRFLRPDPALMKQFLQLYAVTRALAVNTPELLEIPEVVRAVEHKVIHAFVSCLADCNTPQMRDPGAARGNIIARLETFIEAHPNKPLYLEEICAGIGVAERSLRAACEDHFGMGPIRYLTLRRMHLVHRALKRASAGSTTVTQIAMTHGFFELGRFAAAYRALFGEPPMATLRRPPDDRPAKAARPLQLLA